MTVVDLRVIGVPAPQGSKTRMPNGAMVEGGSAAGRAKHISGKMANMTKQAKRPAGKPVIVDPTQHVMVISGDGKRRWVWVAADGSDHPTRAAALNK